VFSSGTTSYTAAVGNAVTAITVTPTVTESHATVTVNGSAVTSGSPSGSISLVVGANTITTVVTAQDGTTTQTYTVVVTRAAALSSVATLSSLALSSGTLSPVFASGTTSYTASVGNAVTAITVTPTVTESHATVTVNGTLVTSGSPSGSISLAVGANTITTVVTAQDGTTTQTYTVVVTRGQAAPTLALSSSPAVPAPGAPVTFTATLSGGASPTGTITFKDGATVLATVALSGLTATYTTSSLSQGTHAITAVYSGDSNNAAATSNALALSVGVRPDPSANGTVRGLVASQVTTSIRFAQAQISNTFTRLEEIHDEAGMDDDAGPISAQDGAVPDGDRVRGGLTQRAGGAAAGHAFAQAPSAGSGFVSAGEAASPWGLSGRPGFGMPGWASAPGAVPGQGAASAQDLAFAPELPYAADESLSRTSSVSDAGRAVQQVASAFAALERRADLPFHLWTSGTVDFGRLKVDGSYDNHFTTSGLTVGLDRRIAPGLRAGVALGYAFDRTTFGSDGSRSDSTAFNAMLYASWRMAPRTFLDVTFGYGTLHFDNQRWSADGGVMLDGERDGHQIFGSAGVSHANTLGAFKLTSYGRVDVVQANFDAWTESGSDTWALAYRNADTTQISSVLGLRASYTIPQGWGTLTPSLRFEYRHAFDGGYTQALGYASFGDTLFSVAGTPAARDTLTGGVMLRAMTLQDLGLDLEYRLSGSSEAIEGQQVRATVRVAF
jgi:uncharacterized protein with beta-barrel porin domain